MNALVALVQAIAYGITRGYFAARYEAEAALAGADEERATDADRVRARNLRAAVERLRSAPVRPAAPADDPRPVDPAPGGRGDDGDGVGAPAGRAPRA